MGKCPVKVSSMINLNSQSIIGTHSFYSLKEELSFSDQKGRNYFISRMALKNLLGLDLSWEQLEVVNHHFLKDFPNYLVSFSHTKNLGAAMIGDRKSLRAVGIDIEFATRSVPENSLRHFGNPQDRPTPFGLLGLWSLKEAAFKALSPLVASGEFLPRFNNLFLKDIWINQNEFGLIGSPYSLGTLSIESIFESGKEILLSKALIYKQ